MTHAAENDAPDRAFIDAAARRGYAAALAKIEAARGWVPDPDAGEPYIYASDLWAALSDEPRVFLPGGDQCR